MNPSRVLREAGWECRSFVCSLFALAATQTEPVAVSPGCDFLTPLATVLAVVIGYGLSSWTHHRNAKRADREKARDTRNKATIDFLAVAESTLTALELGSQRLREYRSERPAASGALRQTKQSRILSLLDSLSGDVGRRLSAVRVGVIKLRVSGASDEIVDSASELVASFRQFLDWVEQVPRHDLADAQLDAIEGVIREARGIFERVIRQARRDE